MVVYVNKKQDYMNLQQCTGLMISYDNCNSRSRWPQVTSLLKTIFQFLQIILRSISYRGGKENDSFYLFPIEL